MYGMYYSKPELLVILHTPPSGDASLILADQPIAADLNIADGSNPALVSATIAAQMVNDSTKLDNYNSGALTPKCTP